MTITDIIWPKGDEELSVEAVAAINHLLTMKPADRASLKDLKEMPLFADIDWNNLHLVQPSFVPTVENPYDTFYFSG